MAGLAGLGTVAAVVAIWRLPVRDVPGRLRRGGPGPATALQGGLLFAGVVGVLALPLGTGGRRYAPDFADGCARLAAALVGGRTLAQRQARSTR